MSDIHIPDVARMYAKLIVAKNKLDKIISEFRQIGRSENISASEVKEMFYGAGVDEEVKAILVELSILLGDAQNLINQSNSIQVKRGRKFNFMARTFENTAYGQKTKGYGQTSQNNWPRSKNPTQLGAFPSLIFDRACAVRQRGRASC